MSERDKGEYAIEAEQARLAKVKAEHGRKRKMDESAAAAAEEQRLRAEIANLQRTMKAQLAQAQMSPFTTAPPRGGRHAVQDATVARSSHRVTSLLASSTRAPADQASDQNGVVSPIQNRRYFSPLLWPLIHPL
jgi:hypothetical protein